MTSGKSFIKTAGLFIEWWVMSDNNDVEILAVVHGARDMKALFSEEWEL